MFVWGSTSHLRMFHSYGDVNIAFEGLQILTYARHSRPLSSEDSLACHTYCDTWHPCILAISEDPWHSHILPRVWQLTAVTTSCDNITVSDFLLILIFLGDGYDSIRSLQWRSSGSDSPLLCFGHLLASYMKINCMKNSLKFSKLNVWCNKIKKNKLCVRFNPSSCSAVLFPIHINRHILSNRTI